MKLQARLKAVGAVTFELPLTFHRNRFFTALAFLYFGAVIGFAWNPTPFAQTLAAIAILSAFAHAVLNYGWQNAVVFLCICLGITFTLENIGVATGLPFGHYHFELGANLPHIGAVPIIVGPLWFGMGYFSWVVAETLLDGADQHPNLGQNVIVLPIVAAFVMTQWDLVMDAPTSTISKAWIWHDGGAYFGLSPINYFGWLLTSWLFYQVFALSQRSEKPSPSVQQNRFFRFTAIMFYASSGLTHLTPWLMQQDGQIIDAAGHIWEVRALRETTVVIMLFTMFLTSALAVLKLMSGKFQS